MERVSTGLALQDDFLHGGIPRGATILVAWCPDTGKTILAYQHGISFILDNLIHIRFIEEGPVLKSCLRVVKLRGNEHSTALRELIIGNRDVRLV